jgi:histidyl-tRNA synthetase
MINRLQAIRGMPDILPKDTPLWQALESKWRLLVAGYGYEEIRLPILENTGLFKRSIGEVTDIVEKEMFTFLDRDNESITLRPEGTAGCVRAGVEHGLLHNQIQRLWYLGPMFRYEKPQKGRYRQFHQIGAEAFGIEGPDIDVEQILLVARFFKSLGVLEAVQLQINSLGSATTREGYRTALVDYFTRYYADLDEDCRRRLQTNPLRILDSKNPALAAIIQEAPNAASFLRGADNAHFQQFQALLTELGIAYEVNPRLVRGLDYYNRTVYEWVTDQLGAQGTVCAGGRYDGLVEQLGGKATQGVGFAIGIERAILLQQTLGLASFAVCDAYIICVGDKSQLAGFKLAEHLRNEQPHLKLVVNCGEGSFKTQFKRADKAQAEIAFILGETELATESIGVKFLRETREQLSIPMSGVGSFLTEYLGR